MTSYGDNILLNVFTYVDAVKFPLPCAELPYRTIYGFMAIVLCLLLATICVIKKVDSLIWFLRFRY